MKLNRHDFGLLRREFAVNCEAGRSRAVKQNRGPERHREAGGCQAVRRNIQLRGISGAEKSRGACCSKFGPSSEKQAGGSFPFSLLSASLATRR